MVRVDDVAEASILSHASEADVPLLPAHLSMQTGDWQEGLDAQYFQEERLDSAGNDYSYSQYRQSCEDTAREAGDGGCFDVQGAECDSKQEVEATPFHEDIVEGRGDHFHHDGGGGDGEERAVIPVHEEFECRICQQPAENSELCAPCRCTGTMKFVHPSCLLAWRQRGSGYAVRCGVCLAPYEGVRELSWPRAWPLYVSSRLGVAFNSIAHRPLRHSGLEFALCISEGLAFGKHAFYRAFRLCFWSLLLLAMASCSRPALLTVSFFHEFVMGVDRAVDPIIFPEQPLDALYRFFPAIGGFGHLGVYEATTSLVEALAAMAQPGRSGGCAMYPTMDDSPSGSTVPAVENGLSRCSALVPGCDSSAAALVATACGASSVATVSTAAGTGFAATTVDAACHADAACSLAGQAASATATNGSVLRDPAATLAAWARVSIADMSQASAEAAASWLRPFQEVIGRALDQREEIWRIPASSDDVAFGIFLLLLLVHVAFCVIPERVADVLRCMPSPIEDTMALLQENVPGPDHAIAFVLLSLPWAAYSGRWLLAAIRILPMGDLPFHEHVALHVLLALVVVAVYSLVCTLCEAVHEDFLQWYADFTLGSHGHVAQTRQA